MGAPVSGDLARARVNDSDVLDFSTLPDSDAAQRRASARLVCSTDKAPLPFIPSIQPECHALALWLGSWDQAAQRCAAEWRASVSPVG